MESKYQIDRAAGQPAYAQLSNILKRQIADGIYLPGSCLPPESELRRVHQLSPMTVRRAIKILLDEGIVETIRGSGTYVRLPELQEVKFSLKAFTDMFQDKDRTQVTILDARIEEADEIISKKLSISVADDTIQMERVLYRDGDPVVFHREYLVYDPYRPVIESEMEVTSLHGLFVGNGNKSLKSGDFNIHASVLTREEAHILNTMELQPAFHIEHVFYDLDERPFSWGWFVCRADRLKFSARVGYRR